MERSAGGSRLLLLADVEYVLGFDIRDSRNKHDIRDSVDTHYSCPWNTAVCDGKHSADSIGL